MDTAPPDLTRLAAPFPPADIEWRVQQAGEKNGKPWARVLAYVTNRAIMERLDEVVGPAGWANVFKEGPAGGVVCGLSVRVERPDGTAEWVTKWDGAENTDMEPVKGGLSGAMKRAAVMWGVGRYLYKLDEVWARVHDGGQHSTKGKDGTFFKWDPPELPTWARPAAPPPTPSRRAPAPVPAPAAASPDLATTADVEALGAETARREVPAKALKKMRDRLDAGARDLTRADVAGMLDYLRTLPERAPAHA